jgi:hypothetical protein
MISLTVNFSSFVAWVIYTLSFIGPEFMLIFIVASTTPPLQLQVTKAAGNRGHVLLSTFYHSAGYFTPVKFMLTWHLVDLICLQDLSDNVNCTLLGCACVSPQQPFTNHYTSCDLWDAALV